jgi:hypothetical protein
MKSRLNLTQLPGGIPPPLARASEQIKVEIEERFGFFRLSSLPRSKPRRFSRFSGSRRSLHMSTTRPKKSGGDRVKFSKINACLNLRNQASINSEPSCSGSVRSSGDASSSEAIQPSLIYTTLYKPPLAGPTTIFTASLFMANNAEREKRRAL